MRDKKALTQARRRAPATAWGEPGVARQLARALEVSDAPVDDFTHGFHSYPARMHPVTARRALVVAGVGPGARVLDPFCGSGTVLVEAAAAGARAAGLDASPLAVLIARAKVWHAPAARRRALVITARRIGAFAVAEGKAARRSGHERPHKARDERARLLETWLDPHVRWELETLLGQVAAEADVELRGVLRACLSAIFIKVSRRASDSDARPLARRIGRGLPARLFMARAEELVSGLDALWRAAPPGTPPPTVSEGDARAPTLEPGSLAAIVSSPPYAGTYDYLENQALRLAFLGLPGERFAAQEIGARRRGAGALADWERGLGQALAAMARALAPTGRAILLVGDSLAGGRAVLADEQIGRLAPAAGLRIVAGASMERLALGRAEQAAFAGRPKREHLILLVPA